MTEESATTKRKDVGTDDDAGKDEFLPVLKNETQVSGIKQPAAPDAALAVNAADLQALVEHARKTGAAELAAKFPNL